MPEAYLGQRQRLRWTTFIKIVNGFPANIYLLKVNNKNTRTRCEIFSNLTKTREWHSGVIIVNFEHIPHLDRAFLSLTLSIQLPAGFLLKYSIIDLLQGSKYAFGYYISNGRDLFYSNKISEKFYKIHKKAPVV